MLRRIPAIVSLAFATTVCAQSEYKLRIQPFLQTHCVRCHGGDDVNGEVDLSKIRTEQDVRDGFEVWESVAQLLRDGIMPPEDEPQPNASETKQILDWYQDQFVDSVEAHPGGFRPRRLSAHEYRNTLHSVFGFPLEVAIIEAEQTVSEKSLVMKLLPTDPPGESGFKNDTSGNPLTSVVWDQYAYVIDFALEQLFSVSDKRPLEAIVGKMGDGGISREQAKKLLRIFAHRAYRRTIDDELIARSLSSIDSCAKGDLVKQTQLELKNILMSPRFFYRGLMMDVPRDLIAPVDSFEFAERLSYFLWADMPDEELIQIASKGKLEDDSVLEQQIDRMLASPKSRRLAEHLGVEWFSLDEIDNVSNNPPVADALKSQPIDYLHRLFTQSRPIMELIDSDVAFVNTHTAKYYPGDRQKLTPYKKLKGIEVERVPNQMIHLTESAYRGGFLTIPGVLAMNRGAVLRGTWLLERVLGEHLPEPPANVGQVPTNRRGENLSFRERFEMHRDNPTCAVCHDKIDPLGFSLQFYDDSGAHLVLEKPSKKRKISAEDVAKIDASGKLPSWRTFQNFQELKQILAGDEKEAIIRNVIERFLAYALCRKLKYYDRPTIDQIYAKLLRPGATYRDLILEICNSLPMRKTVVRSK